MGALAKSVSIFSSSPRSHAHFPVGAVELRASFALRSLSYFLRTRAFSASFSLFPTCSPVVGGRPGPFFGTSPVMAFKTLVMPTSILSSLLSEGSASVLAATSWEPGGVIVIVGAEDTSLLAPTLRASNSSAGGGSPAHWALAGVYRPFSKASLVLVRHQAKGGAVFLHPIIRHVHLGETDKWLFDVDGLLDGLLKLRVGKLPTAPAETPSRGHLSGRSCRSLTRREANLLPKSLSLKYFLLPAIRVFIFVSIFVCRYLIS